MKNHYAHNLKNKMARGLLYLWASTSLFTTISIAQTTYNMDVIFRKGTPDLGPGGWGNYWGFAMCGGDLNADGYSDFISYTDSAINVSGNRLICRLYIFHGGLIVDTIPDQVIIYDSIGYHPSLCIADFNHDGYNDLAIGDGRGIGINQNKGCVNIHYGTGGVLPNAPDVMIIGFQNQSGFGASISTGDVNGDGISDLIVGSHGWGADNCQGRVYVYYGDTLGLHTWPDVFMTGRMEAGFYEFFGRYVASGDDMNGDGYDDIVIGAYGNSKIAMDAGKVYIYYGGAPMDTVADGWIYGEGYEHWLGCFNVSNVSADTSGFKAVGWFGTPIWPNPTGGFGEGKCYMISGDTTGEISPKFIVTGEDTGLGYWSSSAGHADGDRLCDLLAGAAPAFNRRGKVYLWLRRPTMSYGYGTDAYIIGRYSGGTGNGDVLGACVAPAGDVDGDGRDEFLVSNYFADSNNVIWLCKYTGPDAVIGAPFEAVDVPGLKLFQNVPNPFTQFTMIKYQIPKSGMVSLKAYNIAGQLVRTLVDETSSSIPLRSGEGRVRSVAWDGKDDGGRDVSAGVYLYRLTTEAGATTRRMTVIR